MKICVIGDSHTACLKAAWDTLDGLHPEHSLTFFAGPGRTMSDMRLDAPNRRLIPVTDSLTSDLRMTSGGLDAIAVDDYDTFVLVALGFKIPPVPPFLSEAVTKALVGDAYRESISASFARMLRTCTSKPIHIGHVPRRTPPTPMPPASSLTMAEVARLCNQVHLDDQLHFVPQPMSTMTEGWYTQPQFVRDAPRLVLKPESAGKTFSNRNAYHLNTDYGQIWLQQFFACLSTGSKLN